MTEICELLPWDSEFFDFRIGRVTTPHLSTKILRRISAWCEENHIECLYFLADSGHGETTRLAEQNDFHLVDIRITQQKNLEGWHHDEQEQLFAPAHIRPARTSDIATLRDIAKDNHTQSRFFYDPCFPIPLCQSLYQTWIEKSCQGYADSVLVSDSAGEATGYITCHLPTSESGAKIGLLGIEPAFQGQGIGQALVNTALSWFVMNQVSSVSVITQGRNISAQRLYQQCGFLTSELQLWYHRWFAGCSI